MYNLQGIKRIFNNEVNFHTDANETFNNSHNISNIEEFINDMHYKDILDRIQNTQRIISTRRDFREAELTNRESADFNY